MGGEHPDDVIVHNVGDEDQEEDQADLDETLLEGQAEIATAKALERKKKDVTTIENGDGEKIENAKIHADESHKGDDGVGALRNGFTGGARDTDDALELFDGDSATEKLADHVDGLRDESRSLQARGFEGFDRANAFIGEREFALDANLIILFSAFGHALLRSDGEGELLSLAIDI